MERIAFKNIPKEMIEKLMAIENYLSSTTLDLKLLELMRLRVAQINKCAYCVDMHYKELKHTGESELRISTLSVWRETSFFTEKEKAMLQFTEAVTNLNNGNVTNAHFNALKPHFTEDEICNLLFAITQINTWTRISHTFQFEPGHYSVSH